VLSWLVEGKLYLSLYLLISMHQIWNLNALCSVCQGLQITDWCMGL